MIVDRKRLLILVIALMSLCLGVASAGAQDGLTIIAENLNEPRQLFYDSDGTLYITEAGNGGDVDATGVFGNPLKIGLSASISVVSPEGEQSVLIDNLPSIEAGGPYYGAHGVYVDDTTIWVVIGEAPEAGSYDPEQYPFNMLIGYDKETLEITQKIDLFEMASPLNPSVPNRGNPVDIAVADDGTVYIPMAGCNCVESWTEADGVQIAASWMDPDDNPVPTSVAIGPDGDLYVGFLMGFPWSANGARIERWSNGELVETYGGLNTVSDVLVTDDGTIYAVEHGLTGEGYVAGRVVMVSSDGITPIMEGLTEPYGLAMDADGNLVVSIGSAGAAGTGQVIVVERGEMADSSASSESMPEAES
jgi:hypothetical protein